MRYLSNCLTDFSEIWYNDAYYPPRLLGNQKFKNLKIRLWTAAILKIEKKRDIFYVQF